MNYKIIIYLVLIFDLTAADRYLRKGASGSGTSWSDAWDECSNVSWTALGGSTLWIAAGSYTTGLPQLNTANVTIKRATVGAHGTDTGWFSSYDGQVTVTPPSESNFLVIGSTGDGLLLDGAGWNPWSFKVVGIRGYNGMIKNEGADTVIIRGIELDGAGESTVEGGPEDGLRIEGGSDGIIEHNYIHDYQQDVGAHNDGVQGPSCTNITFRYNIFKNNGMHIFLGDYEWGSQYCNGINISYNVFYNDVSGGSYNCIVFKGTNEDGTYTNKIENNVFNLRGQGSVFYLANSPSPGCCNGLTNSYFRNNIVYSSDAGTVSYYSRSNNDYYDSTAPGGESGSITSDPLFTDVSNNVYTLQSGSPAKNAGASLGYSSDIIGTSVPQGAVPDMGAYEYTDGGSIPFSFSGRISISGGAKTQ